MGNCHRGSLLLLRALGQPSWRKAVLLQITGHPDGCRCTDLASDSPLPEVLIWQAWSSHLGSARPSLHYPFILISCSSQDLWSAGWRPRRAGGVAPMSQHSGGSLPLQFSSVQFSSVTQSCTTLCNPMDCSTPSFLVHHQLPELAQTHVHCVADAIQPSHALSAPSPTFSLSQHQGLFQ